MRKGPLIQLVVLAALLVWAYRLAHPPAETPTAAGEAIPLWELAPEAVARITVTEPRTTVVLEPRETPPDAPPYLWVRTQVERAGPQAEEDEGADSDGDDDAEGPEPRTAAFRGNRLAQEAFDTLRAPLARRRIGGLADVDAAAFGLAEPQGSVVVEPADGGDPRRLELGESTFGNTGRYALAPETGIVYLLPGRVTENLKRPARRLIERQLLPFPATAATHVELRMAGKAVSLWRLTESDPASQDWARAPDETEGEEALQAWIRDLARLRVDVFAEEDEAPGSEPPLSVTLEREGGSASTLHFLHETETGWLVRSDYTRHAVRVNGDQARKIIEGAETLIGAP